MFLRDCKRGKETISVRDRKTILPMANNGLRARIGQPVGGILSNAAGYSLNRLAEI
jgi:hypothetical protein